MKRISLTILASVFLVGCEGFFDMEKEIDLIPLNAEEKIVVQGVIQAGYPAYVMLTKSEPYFSELNSDSYENIFVTDAVVTVTKKGGETVDLVNVNQIETGSPNLDDMLRDIGTQYPGFYVEWPFDIFNFIGFLMTKSERYSTFGMHEQTDLIEL